MDILSQEFNEMLAKFKAEKPEEYAAAQAAAREILVERKYTISDLVIRAKNGPQ